MKLEQAKALAKTANKLDLEAEKERDTAEKAVEEQKRQLQPIYVSWCTEALCKEVVQLLVHGMLVCA